MNQLECLEDVYKSDKIKFAKLFCLLAIITNEKETKMKYRLTKTWRILMHLSWTRINYIVTYQSRGSRRRWMLVSSQITLAENTWCLCSNRHRVFSTGLLFQLWHVTRGQSTSKLYALSTRPWAVCEYICLHDSSAHVRVGNNTIKSKIWKLSLFWVVPVEHCCYSDRFFKVHPPTWEYRATLRKKKPTINFFSTIVSNEVSFKAKRFSKLRSNRLMSPQRMSLPRIIFTNSRKFNESQWHKAEPVFYLSHSTIFKAKGLFSLLNVNQQINLFDSISCCWGYI